MCSLLNTFKTPEYELDIHVCTDGQSALNYLFRRDLHQKARTPDVVILDGNLPLKNGFEVLKEIREDFKLRTMPVFFLTTSQTTKDILRGKALGVNAFLTKPDHIEAFEELIQNFYRVELPAVLGLNGARGLTDGVEQAI
jgi:DNA-binding response OmpR family regulator